MVSPIFDLKNYNPVWLHLSGVNEEMIEKYRVLPLSRDTHTLRLAMADTSDNDTISKMSFHTGLRIRPVRVAKEALDNLITTLCKPNLLYSQLEMTLSKLSPEEPHSPDAIEMTGPVIEFSNQLINDAISKKVSDIHIEPDRTHCRIRFRRDGILQEAAIIPVYLAHQLTSRLKIMSRLNIAERRLPQDGRLDMPIKSKIDIRISTCPTLHGEKIVLRILDTHLNTIHIDSLGMTEKQMAMFTKSLSRPQGLILVTGPTGSGKTTTLYAALNHLNHVSKNIVTAEDPVEIELPNINQVNINTSIGLDFPIILRNLLRQDPDVMMIGEIRDKETATIALQAAQTGHLVISTLHTNSAMEALSRLQSMDIPTHLLTNMSALIIGQRLMRLLCLDCKSESACDTCNQGYSGRTGIFEFLTIPDHSHYHNDQLRESGLEKIESGLTDHAELLRVLG